MRSTSSPVTGWALNRKVCRGSAAADAYLYAVTSSRTNAELERIARMQELAGHEHRARRVRQP